MLDRYFKRPVLWDALIATALTLLFVLLVCRHVIALSDWVTLNTWVGDLASASITAAGFMLTCLTVLLTFKRSMPGRSEADDPTFNQFFDSALYYMSVSILKWCVYAALLVSTAAYVIRMLNLPHSSCLIEFLVFGRVILLLSLWRCAMVLGLILKLQKPPN
jgi:hypothetical protein